MAHTICLAQLYSFKGKLAPSYWCQPGLRRGLESAFILTNESLEKEYNQTDSQRPITDQNFINQRNRYSLCWLCEASQGDLFPPKVSWLMRMSQFHFLNLLPYHVEECKVGLFAFVWKQCITNRNPRISKFDHDNIQLFPKSRADLKRSISRIFSLIEEFQKIFCGICDYPFRFSWFCLALELL